MNTAWVNLAQSFSPHGQIKHFPLLQSLRLYSVEVHRVNDISSAIDGPRLKLFQTQGDRAHIYLERMSEDTLNSLQIASTTERNWSPNTALFSACHNIGYLSWIECDYFTEFTASHDQSNEPPLGQMQVLDYEWTSPSSTPALFRPPRIMDFKQIKVLQYRSHGNIRPLFIPIFTCLPNLEVLRITGAELRFRDPESHIYHDISLSRLYSLEHCSGWLCQDFVASVLCPQGTRPFPALWTVLIHIPNVSFSELHSTLL
ncbi:hypothetical protein M422DRAFT_55944 [Sphaerobolus stellatus SS14]|uniref:Unplaced genomic scaffold SPHSTscaffold_336, whole genome shotgun sequence n=1 Tax=Sphaerobolus stellatus (strain SS14) TaxID=990650 RepID=A0A0C9TUL3_SPHS4|nr:hypothetical protein M422DRAFT_55944 [Sphaerobolus stellatus SS14]